MPVQIGLWRVDGTPVRVRPARMPLEERLEAIIESDPAMLGQDLLIIGRQVVTSYGSRIDLVAVDVDGGLHVLELKRDRTPREVVAQVLDYGSWVQGLTDDDVRGIYNTYRRSGNGPEFDEAFADAFGATAPETLNTSHHLTVVASEMDDATERLVTYLATGYDVPINVMFFDYYEDDGRSYLARTWMLDHSTTAAASRTGTAARKQHPWNGQDWYVSFGEEESSRNWDDARRYGFVSAGGGKWFSRTLRQVPVGGRIFAYIPKTGYVGVGEVVGEAQPADEAVLTVEDTTVPFRSLDLGGPYRHHVPDPKDGEDYREWVMPVPVARDRRPRRGPEQARTVRQPALGLQAAPPVHHRHRHPVLRPGLTRRSGSEKVPHRWKGSGVTGHRSATRTPGAGITRPDSRLRARRVDPPQSFPVRSFPVR
ncbi:hypothetical protein ACFYSW_30005 [Rhodococcus aetherivorans]|uniref:hypothetical protein n=1 Tax=Rhodococcus aetherivorans TaxID=191292 RepID=UPI0036D132CA